MPDHEVFPLYFSKISTNPSYHYRWAYGDTMYHCHNDFYEISLLIQGSVKHYYQDTVTKLDEGTLLLFNVKETHRLCPSTKTCHHFTMCLSRSYFQLLMQFLAIDKDIFSKSNFLSCRLKPYAFEYLKDIANKLTSDKQESLNTKLFFYNALNLLARQMENGISEPDDIVDDIITNIRNYTYLTLPVQDIYAQYTLSVPTILKRFKERTGTTVARYQANVKFEYAALMLRETQHSIDYIVDILGFSTSSHFFDTFKQYFDVTPKTYRKINQPDYIGKKAK